MQYCVLIDSGLAVPYSPLFGDTCVPKRVKPNGFCYSVPEVICVFFLSDAPFIFFAFSWFCVGLELEIEGLKVTILLAVLSS